MVRVFVPLFLFSVTFFVDATGGVVVVMLSVVVAAVGAGSCVEELM